MSINAVRIDFQVRITIRPENSRECPSGYGRTGLRIGAGVEKNFRLFRHQGAVFFHAGLDLALDRVTAAGHHRLGKSLHHPHRPLRFPRQRDDKGFDFCAGLAAVGRTDEIRVHPHPGERNVKDLRDLLAHTERMSRGRPDRDPVSVHLGDRRMRFHRIVIDHREFETIFENLIRLGERFIDVPFDQLRLETDVFFREGMDQRRAVGHRLFDVDHRRKLLVIDVDLAQRLFRGRPIQRGNRRHRLAGKNRPIQRDDRVIFAFAAPHVRADIREVFARNDREHTGHGFSFSCVDGTDARMRIRAAQKLTFAHSRNDKIGDVLGLARNLFDTIHAAHRTSNDREVLSLCGHVLHLKVIPCV